MVGVIFKNKFILVLLVSILSVSFVSADGEVCEVTASLVNQDPYPAVPGEYMEILFQLGGMGSCGEGVFVDLILDYPFSLDSGGSTRIVEASTYSGNNNYRSNWNIPYKIRIDPNAIEQDYELELRYRSRDFQSQNSYTIDKFNVTVGGGKTDFEIHVEDYKIVDRNIVFEILNTGNQDLEALTLEIPKQENVVVHGPNRNIVGDLDSNEYTTVDFEAIPLEGNILLNIYYTDATNERKMVEKIVRYDPSYFVDSLSNKQPDQTASYVVSVIVVLLVAYFIFRKVRNRNKKKRGRKFEV